MNEEVDIEQIEKKLEERVRTRIELVYIKEEIIKLHRRIDEHMNAEEQERKELLQKIDRLQWIAIAGLAGLPVSEILSRLY